MTPALAAHLALTQYQILTDFGDIGIGNGAEPVTSFIDAWSAWAERMQDGDDSLVLQFNPDGTWIDVTDIARDAAERWHYDHHDELPDWLTGHVQEPTYADMRAQQGYDDAHREI